MSPKEKTEMTARTCFICTLYDVCFDVFLVFEIMLYFPTCKMKLFSLDLVLKNVGLS